MSESTQPILRRLRAFFEIVEASPWKDIRSALKEAELPRSTLDWYVKNSRQGKRPAWIWERFLQLLAKQCDYCGRKGMTREFKGRREYVEGTMMLMLFCRDSDCEALFDLGEQEVSVSLEEVRHLLLEMLT